ncbi:MAG TPA: DUF4382 domain-containing protein [Acidobacteriaceae bacterium]|nr:DUF4382 domain-containing protein [Acidobacteriaceae bacterium]
MRRILCLPIASVTMLALLTGCGSTLNSSNNTSGGAVPVSLSMTDDPPAGVSVLFFQVSLTAASLTPASGGSSVSLLSNNTPIQIDVTQLQALSAFLSTADLTAGTTYNSLSLTFANPELVIYNQSDTSLGSSCAVGSVCQLTPTVDGSTTVTFTSSPFPVTVSANSPLGLLVDFHLNTVIQQDLSVNLGVANGISVAELPPAPQPQYGNVTGEVESVTASNNQFTMLTPWGRTFTVNTTSSTTFSDFPASACTTAAIGCVASGQIVQVQVASFAKGGVLTASQVTYVQAASEQTAEGTIIRILPLPTPAGEEIVQMLLHRNPNATSGLPLGGVATVTFASGATYSVDNNGFTIPSGLTFTGTSDVMMGQNVQVVVEPGTLGSSSTSNWGGWGPPSKVSFTTTSVALEPSQMTGMISALDSSNQSFTLGFNLGPWFAAWPMASANAVSFDVETTSQTTYQGFSPESFDGLATQDIVSVSGWLFPATTGTSPQIAAQSVVQHSGGWF